MRTVPPGWGAGMRWVGWLLIAVAVNACGGGHGGPGDPGPGTGSTAPDAGASPDGGAPSDCAGLLPPAPGSAYTFDLTPPSGESCTLATSDGQGVVAVQQGASEWVLFSATGTRNGTFQPAPGPVLAQNDGFVGLLGSSSVLVTHWSGYGDADRAGPTGNAATLALAAAQGDGALYFAADSSGLSVHRLDATLNDASPPVVVPGSFTPRGGAQDASGAVLALTGSSPAVTGLWVDLAKRTAGNPFAIGTAGQVSAVPLLGGGVAVQLDGKWAAVVLPGETALRAPPAWLRDGTTPVVARAGKATALVPASGGSIEIVSPQGNSCGTVKFPGVNSVFVGRDGSVIGATGAGGCSKIFWRNALR